MIVNSLYYQKEDNVYGELLEECRAEDGQA